MFQIMGCQRESQREQRSRTAPQQLEQQLVTKSGGSKNRTSPTAAHTHSNQNLDQKQDLSDFLRVPHHQQMPLQQHQCHTKPDQMYMDCPWENDHHTKQPSHSHPHTHIHTQKAEFIRNSGSKSRNVTEATQQYLKKWNQIPCKMSFQSHFCKTSTQKTEIIENSGPFVKRASFYHTL